MKAITQVINNSIFFLSYLQNEAGQLVASIDNASCGYYAYDAQGNRTYKLTGTVVADQYDAGSMQAIAYFDDVTLYVNPYMVVTPRGYTKHYYNGSQRIVARLGGSWTKDSTMAYIPFLRNVAASLWSKTVNTNDFFCKMINRLLNRFIKTEIE